MIVAYLPRDSLGSRVTLCPVRSTKGAGIAKSPLRQVVVPTEHGGWGFTLEPVLLGALIAPGWPALGLAIATFAAFLTRRPLRIAVADFRRERRLARTGVASWSVAALVAIAVAGFLLAVATRSDSFWWPLWIAVPAIAVQLRFDLDNRGRELVPELLGPVALGAAAPMIILAEGGSWELAVGAWVVLIARIVPSILLVRMQLRRAKQQEFSATPAVVTGFLAVAVVAVAGGLDWAPSLSIGAAVAVAVWGGYSIRSQPVPAKTIGWTQMVVGLMVVLAFAIGHHAGW